LVDACITYEDEQVKWICRQHILSNNSGSSAENKFYGCQHWYLPRYGGWFF
jgi:hypothetical protein